MAEMFKGMADATTVVQLDVLFVTLTGLTFMHAISKRGLWSGTAIVAFIFAHTSVFEHVSLFLGGTHCHASSPILPMVTPCSSINSVLFYIPWTYTSLEAARRLNLHPAAFPFATGLLQIGFGAPYEMQGPWNRFWQWPDKMGIIAQSPLLEPWGDYPPIAYLSEAKQNGEVATVASGIFRVSRHAHRALAERLYEFPVFAPFFHFAFGFGWAAGLALTGSIGSHVLPSLKRLFVAGLVVTVVFLFPIWFVWGMCLATNANLSTGVSISLFLSFLFVVFIGKSKKAIPAPALQPDWMLFGISVVMHTFMVTFPLRAPREPSPGLSALVVAVVTAHLIAQYVCCFMTSSQQTNVSVSQKTK